MDPHSFIDVLLIRDVLNDFIRSHQLLRFSVRDLETCRQKERSRVLLRPECLRSNEPLL